MERAGLDTKKKWAVLNSLMGRARKSNPVPPLNPDAINIFYIDTLDRLQLARPKEDRTLANYSWNDQQPRT